MSLAQKAQMPGFQGREAVSIPPPSHTQATGVGPEQGEQGTREDRQPEVENRRGQQMALGH